MLVYLDDAIVFGRNLEIHLSNLNLVLEKLQQANLKVQIKKCEFLKKNCEFLCHIVTKDGIKPNPDKIKEIKELATAIKRKRDKNNIWIF